MVPATTKSPNQTMKNLGQYFFQIVAAALFTALGGVALCVYFEVPLTLRAEAAGAGKQASTAGHQLCEHHAAQKAKADGHATCQHSVAHQAEGHGACESHASREGAAGHGHCEHHASGNHEQCEHQGDACCPNPATQGFQLPPGHPPVPGYTVAKTNSAAHAVLALPADAAPVERKD